MRRTLVAVATPFTLVAALVAAPALGQAPSRTGPGSDTAAKRRIAVKVQVDRFAVRGRHVVAQGTANSRVLTRDGVVRTQRKNVQLQVAAGDSCRVLYLRLADLQVKLLGLDLNTSTVTVRIHGDDRRVLGRLFCQLAQAIKLQQVTNATGVAASLNRRLSRRPMQVLGFRAALYAQQAQAPAPAPAPPAPTPACQLLDLTIGPLNLDLLGLVVDLYGEDRTKPVRVVATADPTAGVLGATLCKLANGQAVG